MRVLLTGGGTGGHLFPALAVAEALRKLPSVPEILFVGAAGGLEATAVPQEGYEFRGLPAMSIPRRPSPRLFRSLVANVRSLLRAREIVDGWKPDVVFATGGYASAPVVVAARMRGVPIVLHEQNSIPGLTNRIACRFAREVHLGFSAARVHFPRRDHLRLTGNPVREGVLHGSRSKAMRLFRLEEDRRTVLVFGGSQGAHKLNEAVVEALPKFATRDDVQWILQTGQKDYSWVLEQCRTLQVRTWVRPFIVNMGDAYAVADLVVCRAGALTLAELSALGKPAILIPYPYATANHQAVNAEALVDVGGALLIRDAELTGDGLAQKVQELLDEPRQLRTMGIQAMKLAHLDACDRIVRSIRRIAEKDVVTAVADVPPPQPARPRRRSRPRGKHVAPQGT
jgi:UDP-N-acetylglucosamine--N-acetylmuramyl-(pentapeptide) pyrophosphoryl-undecaprenol N-acetylglucosamine transferase